MFSTVYKCLQVDVMVLCASNDPRGADAKGSKTLKVLKFRLGASPTRLGFEEILSFDREDSHKQTKGNTLSMILERLAV